MSILVIRAVLLYFLTLFAIKAMGKRQLGQLQPFELVLILIISEMASLAMQSPSVPLVNSLMPIAVLTALQIIISILNLKSEKIRAFTCGRPVMVIRKGKLVENNMLRLRLNLNDVIEIARSQGYFDLSGIENAVMETNGQMSIMPKTAKRPLQVGDIEQSPPQELMGVLLVLDGHVNNMALESAGLDEKWLTKTLQRQKIDHPKELFVAGLDENGQFFFQKKNKQRRESKNA